MKIIKIALGLAAFYLLFSAGWQIGAGELGDIELQDDMRDMASQLGTRVGYSPVVTDTDLRDAILRKAEKYEIPLSPNHVTVLRDGYGVNANLYLAADYTVQVYLPGFSFAMHFNPSSGRKPKNATIASSPE
jgi:hypothetical protein